MERSPRTYINICEDFKKFFAAGQNFKIEKLAKAFGWKHTLAKSENDLNEALQLRGRVIIEIPLD